MVNKQMHRTRSDRMNYARWFWRNSRGIRWNTAVQIVAGIGLRNGTITFGVMTSFLQLVGMIQGPILQLLNMVPDVIHATASIDRLCELDETAQAPMVAHHGNACAEGICFKDVSFRYATGDREFLSHFTHDFKAGSKTAIMGETGIGKTTLFRMILGFVEPTSGEIEVGGELCFVPQVNTLMSGTIRYFIVGFLPPSQKKQ